MKENISRCLVVGFGLFIILKVTNICIFGEWFFNENINEWIVYGICCQIIFLLDLYLKSKPKENN